MVPDFRNFQRHYIACGSVHAKWLDLGVTSLNGQYKIRIHWRPVGLKIKSLKERLQKLMFVTTWQRKAEDRLLVGYVKNLKSRLVSVTSENTTGKFCSCNILLHIEKNKVVKRNRGGWLLPRASKPRLCDHVPKGMMKKFLTFHPILWFLDLKAWSFAKHNFLFKTFRDEKARNHIKIYIQQMTRCMSIL